MALAFSYGVQPNTVVLLGAGFSKAMAPSMPLTLDIGREVEKSLRETEQRLAIPNLAELGFENWMTWLAQRQPYQDEAGYHENQRLFAVAQAAVAQIVRDAQVRTLSRSRPTWAPALVELWHAGRATALTLNYDTLIEELVEGRGLTGADGEPVRRSDPTVYFPSGQTAAVFAREGDVDTFRLLKLHGSIDWYWVPGDPSGASMTTGDIEIATSSVRAYAARARLAGRQVFIVPPLQAKSEYLNNPVSRFVWQDALASLLEAKRVVLIGYSLPLEDSGVASMLQKALTTNTSAEVDVVNLNPTTVASKLAQLGIAPSRIRSLPAKNAIATYARESLEEAARATVVQLRRLVGERSKAPIGVSFGDRLGYPFALTRRPSKMEAVLKLEPVSHPGHMVRPGTLRELGDDRRDALTLGALFSSSSDTTTVRAQLDNREYAVVGFHTSDEDRADINARDDWVVLRAIGID